MNIQYFHKREYESFRFEMDEYYDTRKVLLAKGGKTIAVDVPSLDVFERAKEYKGMTFPIFVGEAICSKKDNYCKAIGRTFASQRLTLKAFTYGRFEAADGETIYFLENDEMELRFKKHGNRVYFIGVL